MSINKGFIDTTIIWEIIADDIARTALKFSLNNANFE